jgi:dihydrofolate reductase
VGRDRRRVRQEGLGPRAGDDLGEVAQADEHRGVARALEVAGDQHPVQRLELGTTQTTLGAPAGERQGVGAHRGVVQPELARTACGAALAVGVTRSRRPRTVGVDGSPVASQRVGARARRTETREVRSMATIGVFQSVTLDGVMQGPGRPDEDTRGGFTAGGWGQGYQDEVSMRFAAEGMSGRGALLFGHRTYDDVLGFWTSAPAPNPFTDVLTRSPKYVVSRSADSELTYPNSTLVAGEATQTVAALREQVDGALTIMGSGELVRSLHAAGLIDQYILQIYPIVLGSGTRLFADGARVDLTLERSLTTTTGVIIAQYAVAR